jgi:hypothetical protein
MNADLYLQNTTYTTVVQSVVQVDTGCGRASCKIKKTGSTQEENQCNTKSFEITKTILHRDGLLQAQELCCTYEKEHKLRVSVNQEECKATSVHMNKCNIPSLHRQESERGCGERELTRLADDMLSLRVHVTLHPGAGFEIRRDLHTQHFVQSASVQHLEQADALGLR